MCFYHFDRPERQQVVVLLAVAPGVPARILSLLQDVHLAAEVHLLEANIPAGRADSVSSFQEQNFEERLFGRNLRSRLDAQGANAVDAQLTYIHALVVDLNHATLEVLLVEHVHLRRRQRSAHQLSRSRIRKKMYSLPEDTYFVRHSHLGPLTLGCFTVSLGRSLGLISTGHDYCWTSGKGKHNNH